MKAKEAKVQKYKDNVKINDMSELIFYQKWVKDNHRVCDNGHPELGKNSLIFFTKFFLARIDASGATYGKRDDYLTMKKC